MNTHSRWQHRLYKKNLKMSIARINNNIRIFRFYLWISIISFLFIFVETKDNEGFMMHFLFEGFNHSGFWSKIIDIFTFLSLIYLFVVSIIQIRKNKILIMTSITIVLVKIIQHIFIYTDIYLYSENNWAFRFKFIFPLCSFLIFSILALYQTEKLSRQ